MPDQPGRIAILPQERKIDILKLSVETRTALSSVDRYDPVVDLCGNSDGSIRVHCVTIFLTKFFRLPSNFFRYKLCALNATVRFLEETTDRDLRFVGPVRIRRFLVAQFSARHDRQCCLGFETSCLR